MIALLTSIKFFKLDLLIFDDSSSGFTIYFLISSSSLAIFSQYFLTSSSVILKDSPPFLPLFLSPFLPPCTTFLNNLEFTSITPLLVLS